MTTYLVERKAALRSGLFCALLFCTSAGGDETAERLPADELRDTVNIHAAAAIGLLTEFLALPNDANKPDDIAAQNGWILTAFEERGFSAQLLPTAGSDSVYAERLSEGAERTVLIYLQADGQPVDESAWHQPSPYDAVLKAQDADGEWEIIDWGAVLGPLNPDWRIFARSAADSKGPMTQFLTAMELLTAVKPDLGYNLKVLIDTEEELGSPNLEAAVRAHSEMLAADMLLIFDGLPHASNIPPTAVAEIDMRLVLESDPEFLVGLVRRHIEELGFTVLDHAPGDEERRSHHRIVSMTHNISYGAFRTDPDAPPSRMARAGLRHLYGEEPILLLTMGGSIPIAPIIEALGVPAAAVPTVNMDNNQHSPNENLRVGNFLEGIAMLMAVLQEGPP